MKRKDSTVETDFHPVLTALLFDFDELYRNWGVEVTITSGSEPGTRHCKTSLHYATPCQAADIRSWDVMDISGKVLKAKQQAAALIEEAEDFCMRRNIPVDWIDLIVESDHIHVEYQPKRR